MLQLLGAPPQTPAGASPLGPTAELPSSRAPNWSTTFNNASPRLVLGVNANYTQRIKAKSRLIRPNNGTAVCRACDHLNAAVFVADCMN